MDGNNKVIVDYYSTEPFEFDQEKIYRMILRAVKENCTYKEFKQCYKPYKVFLEPIYQSYWGYERLYSNLYGIEWFKLGQKKLPAFYSAVKTTLSYYTKNYGNDPNSIIDAIIKMALDERYCKTAPTETEYAVRFATIGTFFLVIVSVVLFAI